MAHYTVLNDTSIQTILIDYGIEKVTSYKVLSGGSENTNYLVKTKNNSFVLTICEQKSIKDATELASLLEYLKLNKFSTSILIKTITGAFTTVWNDKPVMLKEFIEGTIVEDLPNDLLEYLGKELGKLHQVKAPDYLPVSVNYGIEHFNEVEIYAPNSSFNSWLKSMENYIKDHISTELPKTIIHSDIFYNNIIVNEDNSYATIMDFEEACYYYRLFDIGMMIVGTCCQKEVINLDKVANLLKGYQQENKLLESEIKALQAFTVYGAVVTAFWRHQNFNHINIDVTMKDHYLAMKELADHIKGVPYKEFYKVK